MATYAEENYLKAIFKLSGRHNREVSTNAIADELQTKASSVTDMMKKLADKKLIHYKKYQGVTLTKKGKALATMVVRKHRLWEVFLVDKLNFKWDEIHELAEQLEHVESIRLIDKLEQFLGYPKFDPHGDPIPDKDGNVGHHKDETLSDLNMDEEGIIVGVKEHSPDFLQYLDGVKLILGTTVRLKKRYDYDHSLIVDVGGEELMVSDQVSQKLFIKKKGKN
jgi:DtxR family Mn-dependent transcriptional regulator